MKSSPWTWPLSWYWLLLIWNRESRSDINTARLRPDLVVLVVSEGVTVPHPPVLSPGLDCHQERKETQETQETQLGSRHLVTTEPRHGEELIIWRSAPDQTRPLACGALWENITDSSFCITQSHTIDWKYQQQSQSHLCPHQSVTGWHPLSVVVSK